MFLEFCFGQQENHLKRLTRQKIRDMEGCMTTRRRGRKAQSAQLISCEKTISASSAGRKKKSQSSKIRRLSGLDKTEATLMKEVTNQECLSVSKISLSKLSTGVASTFLQEQENVPPTCPLPKLAWANSQEVWQNMREKEHVTNHPDHLLRTKHPGLTSHMRAILLEWMMEVCEVYKLQRETFYLAIDMYERFMATHTNIHKEHLQKIGITCLFAAAKLEEIYPPKVSEFAYVTDGACDVDDMLSLEITLYKSLGWRLNNTITVNNWVNTFLQLDSTVSHRSVQLQKDFHLPTFSCHEFVAVMQLLDLCTLDISSRQFSSSCLAASAIYHLIDRCRQCLVLITGLQYTDINSCLDWMSPFAQVLLKHGISPIKHLSNVLQSEVHNIQTHDLSLGMLKEAYDLKHSAIKLQSIAMDSSVFLTPPHSQETTPIASRN